MTEFPRQADERRHALIELRRSPLKRDEKIRVNQDSHCSLRPAPILKVGLIRYQPTKTNGGAGVSRMDGRGVRAAGRGADPSCAQARGALLRGVGAVLAAAVGGERGDRGAGDERGAGRRILGGFAGARGAGSEAAKKAASAARRSWAACVRKVFEVDPVRCVKCGGEMKLAAVILDDGEL